MKVSIAITDWSVDGPIGRHLRWLAVAVDDAAIDTLWVADHLVQVAPGTNPSDRILESGAALGYLAAVTSRVRLGMMVANVTLRPPALLVKAIDSVRELAGDRVWLGLGVGHAEAEAEAVGVPLGPLGERFDRLEDVLDRADATWGAGRPAVLVGGMGERRTLPLVARRADACNLFDIPDGGATLRRKLAVLDAACADAGRPPGAIERTVSARVEPGEDGDALTARCAALGELGLDHVVLITAGPWTAPAIDAVRRTAQRIA